VCQLYVCGGGEIVTPANNSDEVAALGTHTAYCCSATACEFVMFLFSDYMFELTLFTIQGCSCSNKI